MVMTLGKTLEDKYYDDSDLVIQGEIPTILPHPTRDERREIKFLRSIYRGVMFVTGGAGQGKDLFGMTVSYQMKRYFGRPILLDFKPKRLFGEYTYFNPQRMMSEISKMAKLSEVEGFDVNKDLSSEEQAKKFVDASNEWIDENSVAFQNAVVYFNELARYCPRRAPMNRINRFIGALATQWRHLDMLIIGTHLQANEIDQFTFMEKAKLRAVCKWMRTKPHTTRVVIARGVYLSGDEVITASPKDQPYIVDGGMPRRFLTHKNTIFAITPSGVREVKKNPILRYLKEMKASRASDIALAMRADLGEVLDALFNLSMMGYVVGNRFFDLYPSKNLVNLVPTLRQEA